MQTLLYSRSRLKDYRWIYLTDLCEKEKSNYLDDYHNFENKRDFHLETPHLYVRFEPKSISIYKFINTNQMDSCSRPIYALTGFVLSGMEYVFANKLLEYVVSYFFCNQDDFFTALEQVSDVVTERTLSAEFNVNAIMAECGKNDDVKKGARFVRDFITNNPKTSFFMTEEQIKPINTKEKAKHQKASSGSKSPASSEKENIVTENPTLDANSTKDTIQNQGANYEYDEQGRLIVNGGPVFQNKSGVSVCGIVTDLVSGLLSPKKPKARKPKND